MFNYVEVSSQGKIMKINGMTSTVIKKNNLIQNFKSRAKVSVILPIYNQEKYLNKALDSLKNQTLKELEIICVNDGSKDNSLRILNEYAKKDNRIKIINQINKGAGEARNKGIKVATGEYVAFLDADDWFEQNALETLYKKAKKQNCDMVVFNFNRVNEQENVLGQYNLKNKMKSLYCIEEDKNFNWRSIKPRVLGGIFPAAWNKFYKLDLIKNSGLHFAKSSVAEDNVFVFGATLKSENIGYAGECLYNYRMHEKSALHTKSNKNLSIFMAIDSVKKLLKNLGLTNELKEEFDSYVVRFITYTSKQLPSISKLKELCAKKLSEKQNAVINEHFEANSNLLPILNAIIRKKQ